MLSLLCVLFSPVFAGDIPLIEVTGPAESIVLREALPMGTQTVLESRVGELPMSVELDLSDSGVAAIIEGNLIFQNGPSKGSCDYYGIIGYDLDKSVPCFLNKPPKVYEGAEKVDELKLRVGVRWVDEETWRSDPDELELPPIVTGGELPLTLAPAGASLTGISHTAAAWKLLGYGGGVAAATGLIYSQAEYERYSAIGLIGAGALAAEMAPAIAYAGARRGSSQVEGKFKMRTGGAGLMMIASYATLAVVPVENKAVVIHAPLLITSVALAGRVTKAASADYNANRSASNKTLQLQVIPKRDGLALAGSF